MSQDANGALTPKQVANRRYYTKHAEQIKAQKRAAYARKQPSRPSRVARTIKTPAKTIAPTTRQEKTARSKIEDFELARELGIEWSAFDTAT